MVYTDGKDLIAESMDELHRFAQRVGLKSTLFMNEERCPHYDVSKNRVRVIDNGARYTKDRKLLEAVIHTCLGEDDDT